jgi:hypothetical protein
MWLSEAMSRTAGRVVVSDVAAKGYSVAESAIYEFIHWYDMPWAA